MPYKAIAASVLALALCGCESNQQKLVSLQQEYDQRMRQDWADCYGLALDMKNTARVQKCNAEEAKITALGSRITALSKEMTK